MSPTSAGGTAAIAAEVDRRRTAPGTDRAWPRTRIAASAPNLPATVLQGMGRPAARAAPVSHRGGGGMPELRCGFALAAFRRRSGGPNDRAWPWMRLARAAGGRRTARGHTGMRGCAGSHRDPRDRRSCHAAASLPQKGDARTDEALFSPRYTFRMTPLECAPSGLLLDDALLRGCAPQTGFEGVSPD